MGWAFADMDRWPVMPRVAHFEEPGYSMIGVSSAVLERAMPAVTSLSVWYGWDRLRTASDAWAAQIRRLRLSDSHARDYQRVHTDLPQLLGRCIHLESLELNGIIPTSQLVEAFPPSVVALRMARLPWRSVALDQMCEARGISVTYGSDTSTVRHRSPCRR